MSSKLIGADSEFFSKMIVEAAHDIKVSDEGREAIMIITRFVKMLMEKKEMIILF